MTKFSKRGIGIAITAFLLLGITAIAFASPTSHITPPRGGVKNIGNCGNSWTRVWNANVTLDGISDGEYSADLVGGDFNVLKNLILKGCQMEVLITTPNEGVANIYQCHKANATSRNFSCHSSGTESGTDASGLDTVFDPSITIEDVEAVTSGETSGIFLKTNAVSSTGESTTFSPTGFFGAGGTAQMIVFTKK